VQHRGRQDHREYRPGRIAERADADRCDRETRHQPFGAGEIDQGSARHLPHQSDQACRRQNQADVDLRPFLLGQIDRNERTEAGLHIGHEKDEPIKAAQRPA
jgi:hypothetical protein